MSMFFVFMTFAALSTMIAVFENIIAMCMELSGWSRKKTVAINIPLMIILSMPAVLGFNVLSGINPLGGESTLMDLEDFIVSNNVLPLGSLTMLLFCTHKYGWGWDNFINEVNTGTGRPLPKKLKFYMTWILPAIIITVYLKGYWDYFENYSITVRIVTMAIAVALLAWIFDEKKRK